jgi:hypothetical protein
MNAPIPAQSTYIELAWKDVVRVWWAWQWRAFATGFIATLLGSMLFAYFASFIGLPLALTNWLVRIFSIACWIGAGIYFFGEIFAMDFGHFRVRAVPKSPDESSPVEIPSLLKS